MAHGPVNWTWRTGGFDHLGIRVPLAVVSPYTTGGYVSHRVHSHSSVARFREGFFNVAALTPRGANAAALLDLFDFGSPHFATARHAIASCPSGP